MKRRKFVTAGAFIAALLAAALAAASVGSAATAKTGTVPIPGFSGKVKLQKGSWGGGSKPTGNNAAKNGRQGVTGMAMVGAGRILKPKVSQIQAQAALVAHANRPTRGAAAGKGAPGVGPSGSGPINIPHIKSLPVGNKTFDAAATGLTEFWQEATHGGDGLTPPDQALAEGHGQVLEAVNDVLIVMDNTFHHPLAAEPLEALFAPAILATNEPFIGDPKALYDYATGRWFITTYAFGAGGSSVYIAVSTTSDAFGAYAIYVLDTTFDGTSGCAATCFGDQPLLGADRYTLDISTNSFDNGTGAFNGAQLYVIDKTALVGQFLFPSLWYYDIGGTFAYPGTAGNTCGVPNAGPATGFCLGSVQPAITPNMSYITHNAGTEEFLESLDPLGSTDNRIVQWGIVGTSGVAFAPPLLFGGVLGSETYGFPVTNSCMVMPQMVWFGLSTIQCGLAEQPADGNVPFCDYYLEFFIGVAGACEPGEIQTNDDRMNQVMAIQPAKGPAVLWSGLNTDAMVSDPLGQLHRRSAIAWFAVAGDFSGVIYGQGYIGNWQNDVVFPSIAATYTSGGSSAVAVYSVTGNNTYPSVALSKLDIHGQATSIDVGVQGQDVLDDFCTDLPLCGFPPAPDPNSYRPRYGDYSAAVSDGNQIWVAGELANPSCDDTTFIFVDFTCGGTRGFASNWATGLVRTHT